MEQDAQLAAGGRKKQVAVMQVVAIQGDGRQPRQRNRRRDLPVGEQDAGQ